LSVGVFVILVVSISLCAWDRPGMPVGQAGLSRRAALPAAKQDGRQGHMASCPDLPARL